VPWSPSTASPKRDSRSAKSMADGGEHTQVAAVAMLEDGGEFPGPPNCAVFPTEEHEVF